MLNHFEIILTQKEPFLDAMKNRILLFDGAMGTEIQRHDPKPEDFPNESKMVLTMVWLSHILNG